MIVSLKIMYEYWIFLFKVWMRFGVVIIFGVIFLLIMIGD